MTRILQRKGWNRELSSTIGSMLRNKEQQRNQGKLNFQESRKHVLTRKKLLILFNGVELYECS